MRDSTVMEFGGSTDRETELRDADVVRSGANGRFMSDPPAPVDGSDGFRKRSNGRFVGSEIRDPGVKRGSGGRFRAGNQSARAAGERDASQFDVSDPDAVERVYETGWDETTPDSDRGRLDDTDVSFSEFGQAVETIEGSGPRDTVGAAGAAVDDLAAGRNPAETWSSDRR